MTDTERDRTRRMFAAAGIPTIRCLPFIGPNGRGEKVVVVHPADPPHEDVKR